MKLLNKVKSKKKNKTVYPECFIVRSAAEYRCTYRYYTAANNVTPTTETYKTNFIRDIQVLRVSSRELGYYFNVFRFFLCDELKHHKSLGKTSVYYIMVVSYIILMCMVYLYYTYNTQYIRCRGNGARGISFIRVACNVNDVSHIVPDSD